LACKNVSSITIKNCWSKCIAATGDGREHEEEFYVSQKKMRLKLPAFFMIGYR
jgi:hypothetical protein